MFKIYLFISFATLIMFCLTAGSVWTTLTNRHGKDTVNKAGDGNTYDTLANITRMIIISFLPVINIIILLTLLFCGDEVIKDDMMKSEDLIDKVMEK